MDHAYWGPDIHDRTDARCGRRQPPGGEGMEISELAEEEMAQAKRRRKLRTAKSWAGFRGARNGGRARWAIAASLPIRGARI